MNGIAPEEADPDAGKLDVAVCKDAVSRHAGAAPAIAARERSADWARLASGAPLLKDAPAGFHRALHASHVHDTRSRFGGRVSAVRTAPAVVSDTLICFNGSFHHLRRESTVS